MMRHAVIYTNTAEWIMFVGNQEKRIPAPSYTTIPKAAKPYMSFIPVVSMNERKE